MFQHLTTPHRAAGRAPSAGATPSGSRPSPAPAAAPGRITGTVAVCSFLMDSTLGIISLAVPLAAIHLGAPPFILGLLGGAQRAGVMVISPIAGAASDRWGRKRLAITSATLLTAALLLMAGTASVELFLALVTVIGAATGLFWSPIQAWIGDAAAGGGQLTRSIGRFNVAWSVGLLLGTAAGGALFAWHPAAPFLSGAALTALIGMLLARLPDPSRQHPSPGPAAHPDGPDRTPPAGSAAPLEAMTWWLLVGRLAVFAPYFVFTGINSLFPKLAAGHGYSPSAIGLLLACIGVARTAAFYGLGSWAGWPYRLGMVVSAFALTAAGTAGIAFPLGPLAYGMCFLLVGWGQGIGYASSLYYALDAPGSRGRRSGLHEFAVNIGGAAGALAAGALAQLWGLEAAFLGMALLPFALTLWTASAGRRAGGKARAVRSGARAARG